jgi:hypothetical protein
MTTSTVRREFTHGFDKPYTVTLWGSNPDETDNDDCWTGDDFATREAAIAVYREVVMFPDASQLARVCGRGGWEYVLIDGPDTHELTQNPDRSSCERRQRELEQSDRAEQSERAMQAGMAFGCDGFNDEMGY